LKNARATRLVNPNESLDNATMNPQQQDMHIPTNGRTDTDSSFAGADEEEAAWRSHPSVILNADDWGRDAETTSRTLACWQHEALSSVSAMVFMEDSQRAADLARQYGVDAGLHLNFTLGFTAQQCPSRLMEHQQRIARFLRAHRLASILYNPFLTASFQYVIAAQLEEFERIYGHPPNRIDGHHHMHLCANVVNGNLLPSGIIVRRNLSFRAGEKGFLNRAYRQWQDRRLSRRNRMTDFFFDLKPFDLPGRLEAIFALAHRSSVEIETHPVHDDEFGFLRSAELTRRLGEITVARGYLLRPGEDRDNIEEMK